MNFFKKIIISVAIISIITPSVSFAVVPVDDVINNIKEKVADPLAWMVSKKVIRLFTDGIVNWINTGFEGSPIFVTDTNQFFKDVLNDATGVVISAFEAEDLLCKPFRQPVLLSLKYFYNKPLNAKMRCTLNDVLDNIDEFYSDFNKGGWDAWLKMTAEPQNNPYGAFILAIDEVEKKKAEEKSRYENELSWGRGFLTLKDDCGYFNEGLYNWCISENPNDMEGCRIQACRETNTTPGAQIEEQLVTALGSEVESLGVADEFDEIFAAFLNQMVSWVVSGGSSGGLSGYKSGSVQGAEPDFNTLRNGLIDEIDRITNNEILYRNLKQSSVSVLESTKSIYQSLSACNRQDYSSQITNLDSQINTLNAEIVVANMIIDRLNSDRAQAVTATTANQLSLISSDLSRLTQQASGHSQTDAQTQLDGFQSTLNNLQVQLNQCRSFIP